MSFCTSAILLVVLAAPPGLDHLRHGDAGRAEATWVSAPDCFEADGHNFQADEYNLATDGSHGVWRHPAPEVVLWFSGGCNAAESTNWKLSSHNAPRLWTVIPIGVIRVEVNIDIAPVDFVELLLDGKPLAPQHYLNLSPLHYELPCPAPGRHVLQAKYLHNNLWSRLSPPLAIEVRLPKPPQIVAISDGDRDPIVPSRHGMTSITKGEIKLRLANVEHKAHIVAYIDGKPVASSPDEESCCRIVRVEGFVTPGVHKLTARVVQCPGSCSITSPPSNEVTFHYYDEDVYLLRPGAGCDNRRQDANFHARPSAPNAAEAQRPTRPGLISQGHTSVLGAGTRTPEMTAVQMATLFAESGGDTSIYKLAAFTQAPPTPGANVDLETATIKAIVEHAARLLQPAEQAVSQARDSSSAASNWARKAGKLANSASPDSVRTKKNAEEIEKLKSNAQSIYAEAQVLLIKANSDMDRATEYASRKEIGGNTARAIVAKRRADNVARNRDAIHEQVTELNTLVSRLTDAAREIQQGAERTESLHSAAMNYAALSKQQAEAADVQWKEAIEALNSLKKELGLAKDAQKRGVLPQVQVAGNNAENANQAVAACSGAAKTHSDLAQNNADLAGQQASAFDAVQRTTEVHLAQSRVDAERMSQAIAELRKNSISAEDDRRNAGRTLDKEAEAEQLWEASEEDAALAAATAKSDTAKAAKDENGVRRAQESARAAQTIAADEWKKADSRVAEADAKMNFARAQQVVNPPSPFFFASAAHFPIRDFGLKGQPIDRDGLIIYEDMEFRFDRHGNYEVHFRATTPDLPTTLRLQFQIQPHRSGPWYTVTLAPIDFKYPAKVAEKTCASGNCDNANDSKPCCGKVRECICRGHSEILRRCYGEMGQDARIRREGTARFGFGVHVP